MKVSIWRRLAAWTLCVVVPVIIITAAVVIFYANSYAGNHGVNSGVLSLIWLGIRVAFWATIGVFVFWMVYHATEGFHPEGLNSTANHHFDDLREQLDRLGKAKYTPTFRQFVDFYQKFGESALYAPPWAGKLKYLKMVLDGEDPRNRI